jgi:hypothetical protein
MPCQNPARHAEHICQLKIQQQFTKVRALSKASQYYCKECEAESNDKEALCEPVAFQGKPGILKWK